MMPAFVNHKRKRSGHLVTRSKRRRLEHENLGEVLDFTNDEQHRESRLQLIPKGETKDTPNNFTETGHPIVSDGLESETKSKSIISAYGSTRHFTSNEVSQSLLKKDLVFKYCEDEKLLPLFCPTSDPDNEYAYPVNSPIEREPRLSDSPSSESGQLCRITPQNSSNVLEDYVHRLASLNARACVAAYLQPDKKGHCSNMTSCNRLYKSASNSSHDSDESITLDNGPEEIVLNIQNPESKPVVLNVNGVENVIPVITFSGVSIPPCAVVIEGLVEREEYVDQVPFNTLGLLNNGDTLYPYARVFLEGNHELHLPSRVVPTLVPARLSTVRRAAKKATSVGVVHRYKKRGKGKNNGWCLLGKPLKVIKNHKGLSRKYYAGIKRKKEEIFVRDCVVISAGTETRKNPYVAKIGSIWEEPDGAVMMTTFWYYQSDDLEVRQADVHCVEKELLASQHHDINSVACIEDKCYVVGLSQYCRYHALVLRGAIDGQLTVTHSDLVPLLQSTTTALSHNHNPVIKDIHLVELDPKKQRKEELGSSLADLLRVDPSLVFLCYRGFNHIAGKLQNGKTMPPKF